MLARGLICRLAADAPKTKTSTRHLPQLARLLQRSILTHHGLAPSASNAFARAYKTALVQYCRSYATTAAATKKPATKKAAATKPTATVKRAVKKTAAQKKAPATKRNVTATKKPAATKKPTTKKEPTAKKKLLANKKPAAKKTRQAKKVLTPEEKDKLTIRDLKKKALVDPPYQAFTAWQVFVSEGVKAAQSGTPQEKLSAQSAGFKALTPAEREHYNHIANEKTVIRKAEYKAWVESHTPEEICAANRARAALRRKHKAASTQTRKPAHSAKIFDERHVKIPSSAYFRFSSDRRATGDFKNIPLTEAAKLLGNEWKALSTSEKQPYVDAFNADKQARA